MNFLFKKVDISALVFFRIVFGILGFADVLSSWIGKHFIDKGLDADRFQFKYYGFEWVKTLPDPWLSIMFMITMFAGLGIALGKWYRQSTLIFALGFSYIFFLEKSYYLNHGYLTMVMAWWLVFMPLHRNYSMDVLRKPALRKLFVPYWSLFLLQFMMGVVYFYGGIAKINSDWLNGQPLKIWLKQKSDMPLLGPLWGQEWMAYFMSYGGLLLDLLVVFFLINKRTRIWALGFVLFFHLNNMILFLIGIFPFLSVTLTLLYFEPDFPIRIWNWLAAKLQFLKRITQWWRRLFSLDDLHIPNPDLTYSLQQRQLIKGATLVFMCIMLLVPFRHHLFEGNVAWTEEGHRYSWRMMLRQKQAYGGFTIKNLKTNTTEMINPKRFLTKRQVRKMRTHPDMILQFAHFLRDEYEEKYGNEVAVYANIKAKLNGRKYQVYIDPKTDLAKTSFDWLEHKTWIVPLEW